MVYVRDGSQTRHTCGRRVALELTGRAKEIVSGMKEAEIEKVGKAGGRTHFFDYIVERVGDPPATDVSECMNDLLIKLARQRAEFTCSDP